MLSGRVGLNRYAYDGSVRYAANFFSGLLRSYVEHVGTVFGSSLFGGLVTYVGLLTGEIRGLSVGIKGYYGESA